MDGGGVSYAKMKERGGEGGQSGERRWVGRRIGGRVLGDRELVVCVRRRLTDPWASGGGTQSAAPPARAVHQGGTPQSPRG